MEDIKEKKCYKCRETKPFGDFNKNKMGVYGLHGHCRECQKIIKREWYLKNRDSEIFKSKDYAKSPRAKLARKKRWEKYKDVIGPKNNARRRTEEAKKKARLQRQKWNALPQNRIAQNLRKRINSALKGKCKFLTTEKMLDYTFEQLLVYIESLFSEGMSWKNYGKWHIDHIKPCAAFNLTEESQQKECFHYINLQPLWAKENIVKGAKYKEFQ